MRLDAYKGDKDWVVIHVPSAKMLRYVIWVDDEIHQWAEHTIRGGTLVFLGNRFATDVHQARLIKILPPKKLVLIDPVDDPEAEKDNLEVEWLTKQGLRAPAHN